MNLFSRRPQFFLLRWQYGADCLYVHFCSASSSQLFTSWKIALFSVVYQAPRWNSCCRHTLLFVPTAIYCLYADIVNISLFWHSVAKHRYLVSMIFVCLCCFLQFMRQLCSVMQLPPRRPWARHAMKAALLQSWRPLSLPLIRRNHVHTSSLYNFQGTLVVKEAPRDWLVDSLMG